MVKRYFLKTVTTTTQKLSTAQAVTSSFTSIFAAMTENLQLAFPRRGQHLCCLLHATDGSMPAEFECNFAENTDARFLQRDSRRCPSHTKVTLCMSWAILSPTAFRATMTLTMSN
jgi:hypothetical protein